ncbi:MAG: response regulator transcription factor [Thiohalobacterales bacterium]
MLEYNTLQRRPTRGRNSDNGGRPSPASISSLTAREQEILQLLAEGLAVPVMSQLLNVSRVTVRNHLQHIQAKLGVHSQSETVAYAYRNNLVQY